MKAIVTFFSLLLIFICNTYAEWKPGEPITDERDGQTYKTVVIGTQVWMAENLNIGKMIPTTKAGYEMKDDGNIEKYCWDNDSSNCDGTGGKTKIGGFYEWKEAMNYSKGTVPAPSICPKGWRIPNMNDWTILINGQGGTSAYTNLLVGGNSGFNAILTGYRCTVTGSFRVSAMAEDKRTYFWFADQSDADNAYFVEIGIGSITSFPYAKSLGLCVRCILDEASDVRQNDKSGIRLYPNPNNNDKLRININEPVRGDMNVELMDLLGNVVYSEVLVNDSVTDNNYLVNIPELSKGMYIVSIKYDGKLISDKLMISEK